MDTVYNAIHRIHMIELSQNQIKLKSILSACVLSDSNIKCIYKKFEMQLSKEELKFPTMNWSFSSGFPFSIENDHILLF